ncbi:MqnA/MqnD/SBP family protein [Sulfurimonas sp. HSL-1716]|uniref:MqnA/MqnD/SBP family protein n=1 Tax=Hydrocurvibacter sulfurireducens TaxID=3131937 RepID=UPI0031F8780C
MVFGKIEYLNLLPFHVFIKRFNRSSRENMTMEYKKNVPAKINVLFERRRVDAAFISSIKAKKYKYAKLGIIAKKEVLSVLVIPQDEYKKDTASATSNLLANILGIKGEVLIGDRALEYYLSGGPHIDLAKTWNDKHHLPFVFALLSYRNHGSRIKKIEKHFSKAKVRIPGYILQKASKKTGISQKDILSYLKKISYNLDKKASLGLKKFYTLS